LPFCWQHAEKYIQVHHLVLLASIGQEYRIDPIKDLLPVCANCLAVIHLANLPFAPDVAPDEVRVMLSEQKASPGHRHGLPRPILYFA
jgi:predicted HNH restriction endonuclease